MKRCVVTIASSGVLDRVRALMRGVAEHHPGVDRVCVLVARDARQAEGLGDEFTILPVTTLGLPDGDDLLFAHDFPALLAAAQPWIFEHLFAGGYDAVIFLAPHVGIHGPLVEIFDRLATSADVVLTPYLISPPATAAATDGPQEAVMGVYSPDVLALSRADDVDRMLRWWRGELQRGDSAPHDDGLAADRRCREAIPAVCARTAVLRHPGYNVGRWNLAERRLTLAADGILRADGQPLVLFNHVGFDSRAPERPTAADPAPVTDEVALAVVRDHIRVLDGLGAAWYGSQPYDFGWFADGGPVTPAERARYRRDAALRAACAGRPFAHPELARLVPDDDAVGLAPSAAVLGETWRLNVLCEQLLGRPVTEAEIRAWRPSLRSPLGMARLLLTMGSSPEARRTSGWLARLLRVVAQKPMAKGPLRVGRDAVVGGLERLVAGAAWMAPSLAYRPARRVDGEALPASRITPGGRHAVSPSRAPGAAVPPVTIVGYFNRELGIGEAARSLAHACREGGITVEPIDVDELLDAGRAGGRTPGPAPRDPRSIDILCVNADTTPAAARSLRAIGHHAGYRIGLWHWEQPVLPPRFHEAFAEVDEIWAPSTFVHRAIASVAPVPVVTIPHAIRFAPTPGVGRAVFGLPDDKCLVLVMYDFHSVQERKNPQAALAAFLLAKAAEPALGLVIKTINAGYHPRERQELHALLRDVADVTVVDAALSRQQTWDLERCCDMLLSLHRAEGFGLILAEMMYLGKPVVATGWSANMDFMDDTNSVPIAYELVPLARPIGPYDAGVPWAEPDVEQAAAALRRLANDRDLAARLGRNARETIHRTLDPAVVGARIRERLGVIARWFPGAGAVPPR